MYTIQYNILVIRIPGYLCILEYKRISMYTIQYNILVFSIPGRISLNMTVVYTECKRCIGRNWRKLFLKSLEYYYPELTTSTVCIPPPPPSCLPPPSDLLTTTPAFQPSNMHLSSITYDQNTTLPLFC